VFAFQIALEHGILMVKIANSAIYHALFVKLLITALSVDLTIFLLLSHFIILSIFNAEHYVLIVFILTTKTNRFYFVEIVQQDAFNA
jgi:hypothetical protein